MRQPVLFIGHGSPMNAIENNVFHQQWQTLGRTLPRPRAILCISAHWETNEAAVTASAQPATMHDFGGFPPALHAVRYGAPGDPALAARIAALLAPEPVDLDAERGLDHGSWGVILPMHPDADIPVLQLSLARGRSGAWHLALARRLAVLRNEGVLILASGNFVHNLGLLRWPLDRAEPWAERAQARFNQWLDSDDLTALGEPLRGGEDIRLAIPSAEHYLPVLYALGARLPGDTLTRFSDVVLGSLSMTSLLITPAGSDPQSLLTEPA